MAEKLISIADPALVQSGIVKSLHKLQVPLWIDGQNVIFEDNCVRKSPGYIAILTPSGDTPVLGMQDVLSGVTANLLFGDIENLYRWNGSALTTDGTGYTGSLSRSAFAGNAFAASAFQTSTTLRSNLWSMTNFGAWGLASNGLDPIQINKLAGAGFVDLTGTPPSRAEVILKYGNYILALNTDLGREYVEWPDTDNPEDWVNGDAGFLPIRDMDSAIVAAVPLGTSVAVYSNNTMAGFQYIGPPYIFGAKVVLTGIGAVGKFSVVAREGLNYGISQQGVWKTDGTGYEYISPPYIRAWLDEHVNWGQAFNIAGYLNEGRSMVEWGLPIDGSSTNNITIGYNIENKSWTFRNFGITCGLKKNIFLLPIFGDSSGGVFFGEYGLNAGEEPLDSWVQTKPMTGENHLQWKDIEFLISYIKDLAGENVVIQVGTQEDLDDDISWGDELPARDDSKPDFNASGSGRYISLKIRSTGLEDNWRLAGFDIFGANTGSEV